MSQKMIPWMARRATVLVTVVSLVAACSKSQPAASNAGQSPPTLSGDNVLLLAATRVALPPTGVTGADLPDPTSAGAQDLVKYCVACHSLPTPTIHSATDWPGVVRRMWLRIDRVDTAFHVPNPTPGERVAILRYLQGNALKVTRGDLPDRPGREDFVITCGRCHELPDPRQHSQQDWVAVVDRMSGHMQEMLNETPNRERLERIEAFLSSVSARPGS